MYAVAQWACNSRLQSGEASKCCACTRKVCRVASAAVRTDYPTAPSAGKQSADTLSAAVWTATPGCFASEKNLVSKHLPATNSTMRSLLFPHTPTLCSCTCPVLMLPAPPGRCCIPPSEQKQQPAPRRARAQRRGGPARLLR